MSFGQAVSSCLSQYASFSGRARRSEYWWFYLFITLVVFAAAILDAVLGTAPWLYLVTVFALVIPSIAVGVRRLHDIDKSGWFYLLYLIPLVGTILMIVWGVTEGRSGPNQYGPSPKGGEGQHGYGPVGHQV